jgi:hypothetical protein
MVMSHEYLKACYMGEIKTVGHTETIRVMYADMPIQERIVNENRSLLR